MSLDDFINKLHDEVDYEMHDACANKTHGAIDCPSCCGEQYFDGKQPTYDCEQKRNIYVLRYLPAHIHENYLGALLIPEEIRNQLFAKKTVKVLSLGGGPGSDIAGFKKFTELLTADEFQCENCEIVRVDKEDGWDKVSGQVIHLFGKPEIEFKHTKRELDVCATSTWFDGKKFDVILISYLLSELNDAQIDALAGNLKKCMSSDALLIINDRSEGVVDGKVTRLSAASGIQRKATQLNDEWARFSYGDDIAKRAKPKFSASSRVRVYQRVQL